MVLSLISLVVLFEPLVAIVSAQSTAVIRTSTGPVQGEILRTVVKGMRYSAFKGIPYAEPPLRYLRFKPPVPIQPWTRILNATTEGNVCPQIDLTGNLTGDENCLFLNVFSPLTDLSKKPAKPKAVMVWIYGGSFRWGSSRTSLCGPDFLIENDVIMVSFNYRLGALGFLAMNHPNATGNASLKDQNLVLKWVRDNIAEFGGDPKRVTIFGQSAGSVSVDYHMLSDKSKGLFQRAISMSGSSISSWTIQSTGEAERNAKQLGYLVSKLSHPKTTLLHHLYRIPAYELVMASDKISTIIPAFGPTIENPRIAGDEAFILMCSVNKYASGNFTKVPHIMGFMAKEMVTFIGSVKSTLEFVDAAASIVKRIGMAVPSSLVLTKEFLSSATSVVGGVPNFVLQTMIDDTSDILLNHGIDEKQRYLVANSPEPVYYYQITFNPSVSLHKQLRNVSLNGAGHTDDLAYILYMPAADIPLDPSHPISITRDRMTRMWTNFAKYGNPTPDGKKDAVLNITWPHSGFTGRHLDIGDELSIGNRPINPMVRLMELIGASTTGIRDRCPNNVGKNSPWWFK